MSTIFLDYRDKYHINNFIATEGWYTEMHDEGWFSGCCTSETFALLDLTITSVQTKDDGEIIIITRITPHKHNSRVLEVLLPSGGGKGKYDELTGMWNVVLCVTKKGRLYLNYGVILMILFDIAHPLDTTLYRLCCFCSLSFQWIRFWVGLRVSSSNDDFPIYVILTGRWRVGKSPVLVYWKYIGQQKLNHWKQKYEVPLNW